ncbi:hypothetical protein FQN54_008396 [Arachnomyces sp. PD_36]|nr:hypothetical protein FQN54_008396 [Arachnomyces sp. PD_36]
MVALSTPLKFPHLREVRTILLITSMVGVIFNIVIAAIARRKPEGALGIVFLSLSACTSAFQLTATRNKPVLNMVLDLFFAVALCTLYILVLILSSAVREHIIGVYANMACLVSSLIHAYAFIGPACYYIKTRLSPDAAYCPHCSARTANYKLAPDEQEPRGDREYDPERDEDDERTPLYRDSEDTAVMEV